MAVPLDKDIDMNITDGLLGQLQGKSLGQISQQLGITPGPGEGPGQGKGDRQRQRTSLAR